jgi:hypothetical protein
MTKFSFDHRKGKCVAYLCYLDDNPEEPILVLKDTNSSKHTYIYTDGDILTQDVDCEDDAVHKFYSGDSVTITF